MVQVRPYLLADGGDVEVVSVEGGVVALRLQGACGTCASSAATMKNGIEKVIKVSCGYSVRALRLAVHVPNITCCGALISFSWPSCKASGPQSGRMLPNRACYHGYGVQVADTS